MKSSRKRNGALSLAVMLSVALVGCSSNSSASGTEDDETGIGPGATMEDYQTAFADVEPMELDFQVASTGPNSYSADRDSEFAAAVGEWSGGKITVNVHYAGAIAAPTDVPDALVDGRLDLAHYYTTYEPEYMPAFVDLTTSMVQAPSSPLVGEIVAHAALQEVAFNTPEIMEEFTARGMHPINPANPNGNIMVTCAEEKPSQSDWNGMSIRGNAAAHQVQAEALGGQVSSIEMAEGYEAFQRGILDCSFQPPGTAMAVGWMEVAPHMMFPQEQSIVPGPGSLVAGAAWEQLPLVAKQLIFDLQKEYTTGEFFHALQSIVDATEAAGANGGTVGYLDTDSEAALAAANQELLASVAESSNVDGNALNASVAESIEKWTGLAEELGYTDDGDFSDFPEWYEGSSDFSDRSYLDPIAERFFEEIILTHRPR